MKNNKSLSLSTLSKYALFSNSSNVSILWMSQIHDISCIFGWQ